MMFMTFCLKVSIQLAVLTGDRCINYAFYWISAFIEILTMCCSVNVTVV